MELDELKQLIDGKFSTHDFNNLVQQGTGTYKEDSDKFLEVTGLEFEFLQQESEYSDGDLDETYTFRIGTQFYETTGVYSSWGDCPFEGLDGMYEVQAVQKMITVYERL